MEGEFTVARTAAVPEGRGVAVEAAGRPLALFRIGGAYFVLDNACRHQGGPLCEGDLDGAVVECPLHGWRYDVRTGRCVTNPAVAVRSYPVRVEGDEVRVRL